jgi:putative hydrolase of the HAD superfamily
MPHTQTYCRILYGMVQAVIFDCFGVLVTDGWLPFAEKYFGSSTLKRRQAADLMASVNRGLLDYQHFINKIAQLADLDATSVYHQIMYNSPNEKLFKYIANHLKSHYKIGMLSNTGRDRLGQLFNKEQLALFDELILSYETGYLKPQQEAYRTAADRLGIEVQACVFIDDQEKRCVGAQRAGMQAICYRDFDQMKTDLNMLLSISK